MYALEFLQLDKGFYHRCYSLMQIELCHLITVIITRILYCKGNISPAPSASEAVINGV